MITVEAKKVGARVIATVKVEIGLYGPICGSRK